MDVLDTIYELHSLLVLFGDWPFGVAVATVCIDFITVSPIHQSEGKGCAYSVPLEKSIIAVKVDSIV